MRIIAGEFRGRKLLPPKGEITRPITDRVKQSVFDVLADLVPDSVVYDCFAGTGSLGLESLSRGASRVVFFESDGSAAEILRRNIKTVRVEDRSQVITADMFSALNKVRQRGANLVFLDPPYRYLFERPVDLQKLAAQLAAGHLLPDATVIFRRPSEVALDLPPLGRYDQRDYGGMAVDFLKCPSIPTNSSPPPIPHG
jgi:16S rRNA (guanine966-N2)-methyltransferase